MCIKMLYNYNAYRLNIAHLIQHSLILSSWMVYMANISNSIEYFTTFRNISLG